MHFRTKTLLPFAVASLIIFAIGHTSAPIAFIDRSFIKGKQLENEVMAIRNDLRSQSERGLIGDVDFDKPVEKMLSTIDIIVAEGRDRSEFYARWIPNSLALAVLLIGLFSATLVSWKMDVRRLQSKIATGEQHTDPKA